MLKNKKILLVMVGICLAIVTLTCSRAYAQSTSYGTYLSMDAHSTCTGSMREFYQRNHQISIVPVEIDWGTIKLNIKLYRKGLFTSSAVYTLNSAKLSEIGHTYTYYMGNHDTGKFYYFFSGDSPIYAEPVTLTSYD